VGDALEVVVRVDEVDLIERDRHTAPSIER
jgi:hypothetical protein